MHNIDILDIRKCDQCNIPSMLLPCKQYRQPPVKQYKEIFWGSPKAKVMILGDFIDPYDLKSGEVFTGESGKLLIHALSNADYRTPDFYLTYAVLCFPFKRHNGLDSVDYNRLISCRENVFRQIDLIRPRFILPMGVYAAASVMPEVIIKRPRGFTIKPFREIKGIHYTHPRMHGATVIPVPELPSYWEIMNRPEIKDAFLNEMTAILQSLKEQV